MTTTEYALVLAVVGITSIGAWTALGQNLHSALAQISDSFGVDGTPQ